jgi:hypothetical protein
MWHVGYKMQDASCKRRKSGIGIGTSFSRQPIGNT